MQEPSFALGTGSLRKRGQQGGEFIVRGADGRGGRATVLRPSNRPAAATQVSAPAQLCSLHTQSLNLVHRLVFC